MYMFNYKLFESEYKTGEFKLQKRGIKFRGFFQILSYTNLNNRKHHFIYKLQIRF